MGGDIIMKVYGPYIRKDGRQHVILINSLGQRRTVSYPKWIMENFLGRILDPNLETIHHKDKNFNNNNLSNLEILPRNIHAKQDAKRVQVIELICSMCKNSFMCRIDKNFRGNRKKGRSGPYCSKTCAGKVR